MDNNSFHILQPKINDIFRYYDKLISNILWDESLNFDKAIEHAIAMVPSLLFEIYNEVYPLQKTEEKDANSQKLFCFCINYSSSLYPNNRFHLHLSQGNKEIELKTFCFKQIEKQRNREIKNKNYADCYDIESPLVSLLDLFYDHLGKAKNEFSMNKYFADSYNDDVSYFSSRVNPLIKQNSNKQIIKTTWYWCIDENNFGFLDTKQKRTIELFSSFLQRETYGYSSESDNHDYTNYAAFLAAATLQLKNIIINGFPGYNRWKKGNAAFDAYVKLYNGHSFRQYNIPIFGFQEDHSKGKHSRKVIGNLMIPSLIEINDSVLSMFYEKTDYFLNKVLQYEKIIIANKNAVRSAIAQVMARNLSHNYGSHVLNHLLRAVMGTFMFKEDGPYRCKYSKSKDEKRETFQQIVRLIKEFDTDVSDIEDLKLKNLINNFIPELKNAVLDISDCDVVEMNELTNESLRQIVYLLNHIKCRVDYISDISFGAPMLHTSRRVYGDIFLELDRVSLLMNHISGLEENFKYQIKITRTIFDDNGEVKEELSSINDLRVAVPNDVVGTHAFYNILENIIRNTAKHASSQDKSEQVTTFHIDFSDILTKENWVENIKEEAPYYYCVEIYDDIPIDAKAAEDLVNAQNKRLNDPVFEGEHPRSHSLGLVEMEASAAYLRKLDSSAIDDEQYHVINKLQNSELYEKYKDLYYNQYGQFNLLKAIMKPAGEGKCYFGYRFFMLRPQEVLIVGDGLIALHKPEEGVWVVEKDKFEHELNSGKVFNHEFVVYDGEDSEVKALVENNKTALSPRVLEYDAAQWLKNNESSQTIIDQCWNQWNENNDARWKLRFFSFEFDEERKETTAVYKHHMEEEKSKGFFENDEKCKYAEALSSVALEKLPNFSKVKGNRGVKDYKIGKFVDGKTPPEHLPRNLTKTDYIKNRESVNNRVLVIDERIQDAALKYNYGKGSCVLPYALYYDRMWVTVPKKEKDNINLAEKDFDKIKDAIKKYITEELQNTPYDFMLIHYGILERIFKNDNDDWKEDMNVFLSGLPSRTRIVITSGRGVPGGLPKNVGFVSLSSVTSALIDYKSKYLINGLMYAARKTIK